MDGKQIYQSVDGVAMLVLTMGEDIGSEVLKGFTHEEIKQITHAMSKMKDIKAKDALVSLSGFFDDFRKHSGILGGTRQYITNVLEKTLNGNLARDLVSEIYGDEIRSHAEKLAWIPPELLVNDLKKEHINLQALLIAHLPLEYSSRVMDEYEEEECHALILQISKTQVLTSGLTETLKDLIDRCKINYHSGGSASLQGSKVVANLINRYSGDKSNLFQFLHDQDAEAAELVEEAMFDFFTLFNQDLETINLINERVSLEQWAYALKGTNKDCRLYIINSMPQRVSTELKENLVRIGAVPVSQVEQARKDIIEIVKQMQSEEIIKLNFANEPRLT
ncbi:Flagellar motor switch protein FliG [Vibrio chagasii]|nr:Flagellar motor switch protein FliG [Vibrio chagasii]CAH7423314.1 Flagellar motor switch protein FliG [Vibrio chagasii]